MDHLLNWSRALKSMLACGIALALGGNSFAQVEVLSIQSSSGNSAGAPPKVGFALGGGAPMMLGGMSMGGVDPNNRSALFNLLTNESVRKELRMKDDQYEGVKKLLTESQKRVSEAVRGMVTAGGGNAQSFKVDGIREIIEKGRKESEAALEEILLPEQLVRVRQLAYQVEIAQLGITESLTNGRLGTEIDVHEDQKQHLLDKGKAIEEEARLAIAKIRAAAREKMLAELAPEQRKKAEQLLGPYFDYEEPSIAATIQKNMKEQAPKQVPSR